MRKLIINTNRTILREAATTVTRFALATGVNQAMKTIGNLAFGGNDTIVLLLDRKRANHLFQRL